MEEKNTYWIWLSRVANLSAKKIKELLEIYKDPEVIFKQDRQELKNIGRLTQKQIENIVNVKIREDLEEYRQRLKKENIQLISIKDSEYPENLKKIYDPPMYLYIKGNKEILKQVGIAVIGCRMCSMYGIKVARKMGYELAKNNKIVISGLAKGIDTAAHIGSIEAKKQTIAVLGNGIDDIYPKENKRLAEEILKNKGAILSEYPIGTMPEKMNFPARNRIISGLSEGVLVVEAKEKSGTLITVDFALEQGKNVYAIPGNIDQETSYGTNELIKQGAKLITNVSDILEEM